ncbi:hypothetical protein HPB50_028829 [Hyalomma asiaticum]|nr:hypothetical protein HPB50_028829 [Hyalomma asiaticum]
MAAFDAEPQDTACKKFKTRYCCVKDCPGVQMYRFPRRRWEQQRRNKWITAVRRVNETDAST